MARKYVICNRLTHPNGIMDPDLTLGAVYSVVSDPDLSEAGEYMTVHPIQKETGPDLTKPRSMFKPLVLDHDKIPLILKQTEIADLLGACSDLLVFLSESNPERPATVRMISRVTSILTTIKIGVERGV